MAKKSIIKSKLKRATLLLGIPAVILGGIGAKKIVDNIKENRREKTIENVKLKNVETYNEYVTQCHQLDPYMLAFLCLHEEFKPNVYNDKYDKKGNPIGTWTIGYGSTVSPDGIIGPSTKSLKNPDQGYEIVQWHLEIETYLTLYFYVCCVANLELSAEQTLALASFVYNGGAGMFESPDPNRVRDERWARIRKLYRSGNATKAEMLKLLKRYPIKHPTSVLKDLMNGAKSETVAKHFTGFLSAGGVRASGLEIRRAFEAYCYIGKIDWVKFVNIPQAAMYDFNKTLKSNGGGVLYNRDKDGFYKIDYEKLEKCYEYTNKKSKISEVIPNKVLARVQSGRVLLDAKYEKETINYIDAMNGSGVLIAERVKSSDDEKNIGYLSKKALLAVDQGDLESASEIFKHIISIDPKNAQAYSDLSFVLYRLGRYEDSRQIVRNLRKLDALKMDKNALAMAHYNAGLSCEKMHDNKMALANYTLSEKYAPNDLYRAKIAKLEKLNNQKIEAAKLESAKKNVNDKKTVNMSKKINANAKKAVAKKQVARR